MSGTVNNGNDKAVFEFLRKENVSARNVSRLPDKKAVRQIRLYNVKVCRQRTLYQFCIIEAVRDFFICLLCGFTGNAGFCQRFFQFVFSFFISRISSIAPVIFPSESYKAFSYSFDGITY